jgi:hypothetical protein
MKDFLDYMLERAPSMPLCARRSMMAAYRLKNEVCKDFHTNEDLEVGKGVQMTIRTTKR